MLKLTTRRLLIALIVIVGMLLMRQSRSDNYVGNWPTPSQWHGVVQYQWANEPWTGNDLPFKNLRKAIDAYLDAGQSANDLRLKYAEAVPKDHFSTTAIFQWAYASWKASVSAKTTRDKYSDLYTVPENFVGLPDPHSYNFDRIRFLVGPENPNLVNLGQRLLIYDPEDTEVEYKLLKCMDVDYRYHPSTDKKIRNLRLSEHLLKVDPKSARSYSGMAAVYYSSWEVTHDLSDKSAAIKYYQEYLNHTSASDDWRPTAIRYIQRLQQSP